MINLRKISDDFFTIGDLAILQKHISNDIYDFNFRNYFICRSVVSESTAPVLLHIGAIEDYAGVDNSLRSMGMRLLVSEAMHLRCSIIENWYPLLQGRTPFTKVYDELPSIGELMQDFSFPVFIKGNRQTDHHKKSQCIIESPEAYEALQAEWRRNAILSWQKVAVREYIPLQTIDAASFPDMVPISYEFRFFYFDCKCVGYGPYWHMGKRYVLKPEDQKAALELADWVAQQLSVWFLTIDLAKTADGRWIVIEVNDAQESGFSGANPIKIWNNIIDAAQKSANDGLLLPAE